MKALNRPVILFLASLWLVTTVQASTSVKVGSPAPPLSFQQMLQAPDGLHGTWEELKGKAVVLEFWATWCGECVDSIPHLNELAEQFQSQPLEFISITDETDIALVKRFLAAHPIRGWVALDAPEGTFKRYEIDFRPQTLLIDRNGVVQAVTNPASVTHQVLEDLLAGKTLNVPTVPTITPLGLEANAPPPLMQVLIRPAASVEVSHFAPGSVRGDRSKGRYDTYGVSLRGILSDAYDIPESRIAAPEWCSKTRYDLSVVTPQNEDTLQWPLVKQVLEAAFHLKLHTEVQDTRVYVLRKVDGQPPKLRPTTIEGNSGNLIRGKLEAVGKPIGMLTQVAGFILNDEVVDETGLTGRYDYELKWDSNQPASIITAIREQLGLELVAQQRKQEHLVVDSIQEPKSW